MAKARAISRARVILKAELKVKRQGQNAEELVLSVETFEGVFESLLPAKLAGKRRFCLKL